MLLWMIKIVRFFLLAVFFHSIPIVLSFAIPKCINTQWFCFMRSQSVVIIWMCRISFSLIQIWNEAKKIWIYGFNVVIVVVAIQIALKWVISHAVQPNNINTRLLCTGNIDWNRPSYNHNELIAHVICVWKMLTGEEHPFMTWLICFVICTMRFALRFVVFFLLLLHAIVSLLLFSIVEQILLQNIPDDKHK